jgi:DNA-binding NtrC family response regulator
MERAVALGDGDVIESADLPLEFSGPVPMSPEIREGEAGNLKSALQACEERCLIAALRRHGGHRGDTARALGISRKALWEKLQRFGISEKLPKGNIPE